MPAIPAVPSTAKKVNTAGAADDTASIQAALDKLKPGDWLVFPPDTYVISKRLTISIPNVTLYGSGATLKATNPTDGAVVIAADNVSVYNFHYIQNSTTRQTTPWSGGISVYQTNSKAPPRISGATIQGNKIENSAAVGIFLSRADEFTVAANTIVRSLADGIHVTAGSTSGRIINNSVSQTGDDMIGLVSYTGQRTSAPALTRYKDWPYILSLWDQNIYIAGNELSDNYWGRGIAVVGARNVTIENNSISRVPAAAGVYIQRETSFMTLGNNNVLVRGNTLAEIETQPPTYKPANINLVATHQGAFEIGSMQLDDEMTNTTFREAFSVTNVSISGNELRSWGYAPIRVGMGSGLVSNIFVLGNKFTGNSNATLVDSYAGLQNSSMQCANNQLNGANTGAQCAKAGASAAISATVPGAKLSCTSDGHFRTAASPKEPSNLSITH